MASDTKQACSLTLPILWATSTCTVERAIPLPAALPFNAGDHPHVLGIFAPSKQSCKATLYYLDKPDVTKLTLVLDKIDNDVIVAVSSIINEVKDAHIHVSGFCQKEGKYIYEIYARGKRDVFSGVITRLESAASPMDVIVEEIQLLAVK